MPTKNAIDWHSSIATNFDAKYSIKGNFIERAEVWGKLIAKYSAPDYRVADIGCGSGVFSFQASMFNQHVMGLDGSAEMIQLCKQKLAIEPTANIEFAVAELNAMPAHAGAGYDLLICSSVLEYVDDLPAALTTLKAMTRSGGTVLLSMPNKSSFYRKLEALLYRVIGKPAYYQFVRNVLTLNDMQRLLVAANLDPIEHRYFANVPLISGLLARFGLARYSTNLYLLAVRCR